MAGIVQNIVDTQWIQTAKQNNDQYHLIWRPQQKCPIREIHVISKGNEVPKVCVKVQGLISTEQLLPNNYQAFEHYEHQLNAELQAAWVALGTFIVLFWDT